jgi:LPS sulfotransferase NodH
MDLKRLIREGARHPGRAGVAVMRKLLAPVGHRRFRRFIVMSRSRTGSNLLMSLLNSHPNIHAEGEVFSHLRGRPYTRVLARTFARQAFFVKAKGFKIFYYHPQDDPSGEIWNSLAAMDDLHVIHLKRRNVLRTLVSRKLAGVEGRWRSAPGSNQQRPPSDVSVSFDVPELEHGFRETRAWEQAGEERFHDHSVLTLEYESMLDRFEETSCQVLSFLGVPQQRLTSPLEKQHTRSLRDMVVNYDALKLAFTGTDWQEFFDE